MKFITSLALTIVFAFRLAAAERPNIVLILADDLGFSDIACYGGEIKTPNIDKLAATGLRFSQFYNGARCCPTRASLLTGLYAHQAGVGHMVDDYARGVRERMNSPAYTDRLNPNTPTIAETLRAAGYKTFMSGKWHLGYRTNEWPAARGFDRSFALIHGAVNYFGEGIQNAGPPGLPLMSLDHQPFTSPGENFFATEDFTRYATRCIEEHQSRDPFFLYLAYTAPHWPLHARAENIARHRGRYKSIGWDKLREQRLHRLKQLGILDARTALAPRAPRVPEWEKASAQEQDQWDYEMAIYAAQTEEMDEGIGQLLTTLAKTGRAKNTVIIFLSDNGGAAEDPNRSAPNAQLGARESYEGYRIHGAHVSSAPFRKTKKFTHEGGIATPCIIHGPGIASQLTHSVAHIIDLAPTLFDIAGAKSQNLEGISLTPLFSGKQIARREPLFWEHEGNRAARDGDWKIASTFGEPWELYDLSNDRTELKNLAAEKPETLARLKALYDTWATRVQALPWQQQ